MRGFYVSIENGLFPLPTDVGSDSIIHLPLESRMSASEDVRPQRRVDCIVRSHIG